ncbi:YceI family protein [Flavobacterium aquicola]|uniref:YceI-like domain-containing protein n=1 Tax=Flavobacterium aquicola TaxID=1682742 RepID=A0A3E0EMW8_9FLAO|nr:YceI family protein [Flavobacterium aquicola]REG99528.1 YceI-like domain-containing protein [Flavobacterium aquicola]
MKKTFINFFVLLLITAVHTDCFGQKLITKTGSIKFQASMPSYEEVAAENKSVSAVLEQSTGDFAALVLIKGFRFKVALMEEHFNENYMESEKFSKATFKGKIEDFNVSEITNTAKNFTLKGDLTVHGKTKAVSVIVKVSKTASGVNAVGSFEVKPEDFDIEIPSVVSKKIADKIKIAYNFTLSK